MKGMSLKYLTKEGFRNVWVNRLMSLASITVLMACLVIIGAGTMLYFNINSLLDVVQSQNIVMVYIQDDATDLETSEIGVKLKQMSNIENSEFVPKEDAFKQQVEAMGADNALFDGFTESPLPDAYKVTISDLNIFSQTVAELKSLPKVETVRENGDLASKLISVRKAVTIVSLGLVAMLFLVALFIISNTIRITMFSRKLEISIMKAVGATNWFIRWPFMIEGVLLGIISGLVSLGILWGLYELATVAFSSIIEVMSFKLVPFTNYVWAILGAFVGIGVFTGGFGSLISMGKYLKEQGSVVTND